MKKSLLALAVLASIAGVASAQSSVTIYGVVDAGFTRETGGAAGTVNKLATGVQSGNRLGFKGTEDLGGGLKANFQLESGFNLDDGTQRQGALFGRQAFVGLSGAFGAVNLGRQYSPIFVALDTIDPFGTGMTGAITNIFGLGGDSRINNAVTYSSVDMGGFSFSGLYGAGEKASGSSDGRTLGASGTYAKGPFVATVAYHKINTTPAAGAVAATADQKVAFVGATYNFGPVTAHAGYETEKSDIGKTDYRDAMLGLTVPVGPGNILASYSHKSDRVVNTRRGAKQMAVGYTYSLSKRSNVYTSYSRIDNNDGADWVVGDASSGGTKVAPGKNSGAFTVGLRHKF
jgi:predicted porin